jgi:redox-sensitive bicupin YhaK (pirin superfamily)
MLTIRPADLGWLDSRHTFSFGSYRDPDHQGFRALRVLNDDRVLPGGGFGTHPHADMEILSYVVAGALQHADSMGHSSVIRPGELQRMTAGTGVTHSEYNPSRTETLRFLQIWVLPVRQGLSPGYEQRAFPLDERRGELRLLASADGREGSITVHQEVELLGTILSAGQDLTHILAPGRHAWLQVVRGDVTLLGKPLTEGDGVALSEERELHLEARSETELLLLDLA